MRLLRGVVPGAIAMLPNLFPAVVVFGIMGWLNDPIDIGTMMTASVALGIAVDDTFHFVQKLCRVVNNHFMVMGAITDTLLGNRVQVKAMACA